MTNDQIFSEYAEKLTAKENADAAYDKVVREIGRKIEKSKGFHYNNFVDSIYGISDNGVISYGVRSTDSDVTGSGTTNIKELID